MPGFSHPSSGLNTQKMRATEAFTKYWSLRLKMFNPQKKQGVVACLWNLSTGEEDKVGL